jgi:hypothetical protein
LPSMPVGTDKASDPVDRADEGLRRVDQAALMGAALAAILAIFVPEGSWDGWGVVVGVTLSFVIAGYYRIPSSPPLGWRDALTRAGAVASVAALCLSIALAYPLQRATVSRNACKREVSRDYPSLAADRPDRFDELADNCVGGKAGDKLQPLWLGIALEILLFHLVMWHPRASKTENATAHAKGTTHG